MINIHSSNVTVNIWEVGQLWCSMTLSVTVLYIKINWCMYLADFVSYFNRRLIDTDFNMILFNYIRNLSFDSFQFFFLENTESYVLVYTIYCIWYFWFQFFFSCILECSLFVLGSVYYLCVLHAFLVSLVVILACGFMAGKLILKLYLKLYIIRLV